MNNDLLAIQKALSRARSTTDVFGPLCGSIQEQENQAKRLYRMMVKKSHPDFYFGTEKDEANEMFLLLTSWWQTAQLEIRSNTYGKDKEIDSGFKEGGDEIKAKKNTYRIVRLYRSGDLSDIYLGEYVDKLGKKREVAIKIAVDVADNEFIKGEASNLKKLKNAAIGKYETFTRYLPTLVESFVIKTDDGKRFQGNAFKFYKEFYTLAEVISAYPGGVSPKNMAWMWNRILEVLGYVHKQGLIHGGITPEHVLIHPIYHSAKLIDWCSATSTGRVRLISVAHEDCYAPEIPTKKEVSPATDIYMSTQCMIRLLGAKNIDSLSPNIPAPIMRILKSCVAVAMSKRPQDAWELRDEFEEILKNLYGERSYCEFKMPVK